jgi:hypothetical protein
VLVRNEAVFHDLPFPFDPSVERAISVERGNWSTPEAHAVVTLSLLVFEHLVFAGNRVQDCLHIDEVSVIQICFIQVFYQIGPSEVVYLNVDFINGNSFPIFFQLSHTNAHHTQKQLHLEVRNAVAGQMQGLESGGDGFVAEI